MSTTDLFPETSALYRLRVTAEADLGALSRVLERFQNLNVVPGGRAEMGSGDILYTGRHHGHGRRAPVAHCTS